MMVNISTIGASMSPLPNQSTRRKLIGLTYGRCLLRGSGLHEMVYYTLVILGNIGGFLVYIDGCIQDTCDMITVAVVEVLSVR